MVMPELVAKPRKARTTRPETLPLKPREDEALRILRELSRENAHAPKTEPVVPNRANRYIRPQ